LFDHRALQQNLLDDVTGKLAILKVIVILSLFPFLAGLIDSIAG
jgi:hypothetical protein